MSMLARTIKATSGRMGVISPKGEVLIPVTFVSIDRDEEGNYVCTGTNGNDKWREIYNSNFERVN